MRYVYLSDHKQEISHPLHSPKKTKTNNTTNTTSSTTIALEQARNALKEQLSQVEVELDGQVLNAFDSQFQKTYKVCFCCIFCNLQLWIECTKSNERNVCFMFCVCY